MARRKPPTDDEVALFREAMRGVAPLPSSRQATPRQAPPAAKAAAPEEAPPPAVRARAPRADGSGVQARTLQRLRRGQLRPEATLDLHGHTRHEAHQELEAFLARVHASGRRVVLVIHGIGRGSHARGVLREAVPRWLADHPEVLASAPAQPADGGAGACYVLLRRPAPPR